MNRAIKPARVQAIGLKRLGCGRAQFLALITSTMLAVGLVILLQLTPASAAEGDPGRSLADAGAATGNPLSGPGGPVRVTEASVYTISLPYIVKGFRLPNGPFGAQIYVPEPTAADRMSEMGIAWVRLPLSWWAIEPDNTTPADYNWSASFEEKLTELSAHHVQVILQVGDNPPWAATYLNGPIDPDDLDELTEFIQAVVARYSQPPYNVKYWEMYNEPDNGNVLFAEQGAGYFGHTPEAYVDILEAVYNPIKAVDPEAKVLLGGLAYDLWEPEGPFVEGFLDQVLIDGGAAYFDLMNFHYYLAFRANWEPYGHDILGKLAYLRDKMADYGVDKPFVCTETGWFTSPDVDPPGSDEVQSRYVVQSYVRSMTADLAPVIWFTLLDNEWDPRYWGLLDLNLEPKPSYYAYQTLTAQLGRANYVRTLGPRETGSNQIEAYEFTTPPDRTVFVAWSNDNVTREVELGTLQVLMVDKFGSETIVRDRDDGLVDGLVHVSIGPSPAYLRIVSGVGR